jgi:predicted nucleic acid-binding protein
MGQYLIDNNVISNYFSSLFSDNAMNFMADVIDQGPNISVITEIEALSWINPDKKKEEIVQEFIGDANILSISPDVVRRCVVIRRSKKIKTPDAVIAATAINHGFILITSDAGLKGIQGLQIIDPFDLK